MLKKDPPPAFFHFFFYNYRKQLWGVVFCFCWRGIWEGGYSKGVWWVWVGGMPLCQCVSVSLSVSICQLVSVILSVCQYIDLVWYLYIIGSVLCLLFSQNPFIMLYTLGFILLFQTAQMIAANTKPISVDYNIGKTTYKTKKVD